MAKQAKRKPAKRAQKPAPKIASTDETLQSRGPREETRDVARKETGRKKRIPLGTPQAKMMSEHRPGYVRYWFNDKPGRVRAAQDAGYSFVEEEDQRRSMNVGTHEDGSPMAAYLMEIPEEFYKEDQALKQVPLDEFEAAINGGTPQGAEGQDRARFYSPDEGSKAISR